MQTLNYECWDGYQGVLFFITILFFVTFDALMTQNILTLTLDPISKT
jgi:hypothetical protein